MIRGFSSISAYTQANTPDSGKYYDILLMEIKYQMSKMMEIIGVTIKNKYKHTNK